MGGHPQRQVEKRPECGKVGCIERRTVGLDDGELPMAVGGGAAVSGDVLEHRQNAPGQQAIGDRARQRRDLVCRLPIGAVADDRVGAGNRNIRDRQAIHVDTDRNQVLSHQTGAEMGGFVPVAASWS